MSNQTYEYTCAGCGKAESRVWRGSKRTQCETCWNREYRERNRKKTNEYSTKYRLKMEYNLTVEQFERMLADQQNRCAIGGELFTDNLTPVVDHDHVTGKVRGLLCTLCNTGIGMLRENPERLFSAFNYLENAKGCR